MNENADVMDSGLTKSREALWYRLGPIWSLLSLLAIVYIVTLTTSFMGDSVQVQLQYALVNLIIVVALQRC